jgi:hypothetical protein
MMLHDHGEGAAREHTDEVKAAPDLDFGVWLKQPPHPALTDPQLDTRHWHVSRET